MAAIKQMTRHFSPNGDGRLDVSRISVRVRKDDDVTITIVDEADNEVRRLATGVPAVARQSVRVRWDGGTEQGGRAPEGVYRVRVGLRRGGRAVTLEPGLRLDTTAPRPTLFAGGPDGSEWITGPVAGRRPVPRPRGLEALSRRRSACCGPTPGSPRRCRVRAAARRARGRMGRQCRRPPRRAGDLPARRGGARRGGQHRPIRPGRSAARHGARPARGQRARPDRPAPGRSRARRRAREFAVDSRGRPYRWRIYRVGERKPRRKGRKASGGELKVRAPRGSSGALRAQRAHGQALGDGSVRGPGRDDGADPRRAPGGHVVRAGHARRRP